MYVLVRDLGGEVGAEGLVCDVHDIYTCAFLVLGALSLHMVYGGRISMSFACLVKVNMNRVV